MKLYKKIFLFALALALFSGILSNSAMSTAAISRSPKFNVRTLSMTKKMSYTLRIYNSTGDYTTSYSSSDPDVISIRKYTSTSCNIKAKSSGTATITATLNNSATSENVLLKCKVKVSPPAVSVKFHRKKMKLNVGEVKRLKYSIKPGTSSEQPRFSSEEPSIATISSTGILVGMAPGKTIIHVQISNGRQGSCMVTINQPNKSNKPSPSVQPAPSAAPSPATTPVPSPQPSVSTDSSPTRAPGSNSSNYSSKNNGTKNNLTSISNYDAIQ